MVYDADYYESNKPHIRRQYRRYYASNAPRLNAGRRTRYAEAREVRLAKARHDRAPCPLCGLTFRRLYIPKHIELRHENKAPIE